MTSSDEHFPFFSVVIPVYNRYYLVVETVKSVLSQRNKDFEIILVDDGSTDGSGEKMTETFSHENKIRILHQQNSERAAARNNGFKESKGEYVLFLDSDDLLLPEHLEVLYDQIKKNNSPDFIATKFDFLREQKRVDSPIAKYPQGYYDYRLFLNGNPLACNICVKRKNPKLILFFEDRRYSIKEDWMFLIQNLRNQKLYLIDQVTLLMVDHEFRSMREDNQLLIKKTFLAMDWILENVTLNDKEKKQVKAHVNYFCAIHSYLDKERTKGLSFLFRAINFNGLKIKYLVLLPKILLGRNLLFKLRP